MNHRPMRSGNRPVEAEILMFTGVRYEAQSGWLKPTDIATGVLTGGPLQLGGPQHTAKDPKPC